MPLAENTSIDALWFSATMATASSHAGVRDVCSKLGVFVLGVLLLME